jgi:hypothetical protein
MSIFWSAAIYAGLGDKDEAFRLREKAQQEHSADLPISQWTRSGMECVPIPATLTCCAGLACYSE